MTSHLHTSFPWVGTLFLKDSNALGEIRTEEGLEGCISNNILWVRGPEKDNLFERRLLKIPWKIFYEALSTGELRIKGESIPSAYLPQLQWSPLQSLISPTLPATILPGISPASISLQLTRSQHFKQDPNAMICDWGLWKKFVSTALTTKLRKLRFSKAGKMCLVLGHLLPPLPGSRFVNSKGILIPAGYQFIPILDENLIRMMLQLADGDLALLNKEGVWTKIPTSTIYQAQRSTIKAIDAC